MILEPLQIRRPFDPTGKSRDNYIHNEIHTLPHLVKRIIAPRMGAFYAESLRVRYGNQELVLGKDYELAALYHDATVVVGKDVNVLIVFTNENIVGDVEISYQVVGGEYTGTFEMIQKYVNVLLVDPRKVRWDDILAKPDFYAPREHFHDINDVYGLNELIPYIEELRQALVRIRSKEFRKVYDRLTAIRGQYETDYRNLLNRLNTIDARTGGAASDVESIKARLRDALARIGTLESSTALQTAVDDFNEKLRRLQAALDNTNNLKADKSDVDRKYDQLLANINNYFTAQKKLKNQHIPLSSAHGNLVELKDDGLFVSPSKYNENRENPTKYYVDSAIGRDNGNTSGTTNSPFRTVQYALSLLGVDKTYEIHLKGDQVHILPYGTDSVIHRNRVTIKSWLYGNTTQPAILQFGNDNRQGVNIENGYRSQSLELNESILEFTNVIVRVKNDRRSAIASMRHRAAINIRGSSHVSTSIIFGIDTKVDLAETQDILFNSPRSGVFTCVLPPELFDTNKIEGSGQLFAELDMRTHLYFTGFEANQSARFSSFVKFEGTRLDNLKRYLPQLRKTVYGLMGNVVANIDPSTLPYYDLGKAGLSNVEDNRLQAVGGGYYLGSLNPETNKPYVYYIDGQAGNDNNTGEFVAPFRSIYKAISVLKSDAQAFILLKEKQAHVITQIQFAACQKLKNQHLYFQPYGVETAGQVGRVYDANGRARLDTEFGLIDPSVNCNANQALEVSKLNTSIKVAGSHSADQALFGADKNTSNNDIKLSFSGVLIDLENNGRGTLSFVEDTHSDTMMNFINGRFKGNNDRCSLVLRDKRSSTGCIIHLMNSETDTRPYFEGNVQFTFNHCTNLSIIAHDGMKTYLTRNEKIKDHLKTLTANSASWNDGLITNVNPKNAVKLSKASDNLLHVHEDGIYTGRIAPPELAALYVDALAGNDETGDGTKARPYQTIKKAVDVTHGYTRWIHIKEGQDHLIQDELKFFNDFISIQPYGPSFDALPGNPTDLKATQPQVYRLNTKISFKPRSVWGNYLNSSLLGGDKSFRNIFRIYGCLIRKHPHQHKGESGKILSSYQCIDAYDANINIEFRNCGIEFVNNPEGALLTGRGDYRDSQTVNLSDINEISGEGRIFERTDFTNITASLYGGKWEDANIMRKYMPNIKRHSENILGINLNVTNKNIFPINVATISSNTFALYCNPTDNTNGIYAGHPDLKSAVFRFLPNDHQFVSLDKMFKAVDYMSTSDIRQKEDIEIIDNPIEKLQQLHGYTFKFKGSDKTTGGVIAQEVEQVLPAIIKTDDEGMKSLSYNAIIGLLVEVSKSQQQEIDQLKALVQTLTEQVKDKK